MLYGGSTQCRTKAEDGTITTLKCFNTLPCGGMGVGISYYLSLHLVVAHDLWFDFL